MQDSNPPKTAIVDTRVPLGYVYVDLSVDEVLEACSMYINNKKFDNVLDAVYDGGHIESWDYWSQGDVK
jgi:hypothetical protein